MREWDQPTFDRFDPDRPAHVEDRLNELRLAKDVKVTAIGMDSITEMHAWDAYVWLKRLKRDMPRTKFVIEPRWCDFIHTMGPMYLLATRSSAESGWEITQPHYLADFLNPGHEIWAMIDHYHLNERLGREATIPEMKAELQRFASMGYVPLEHWRYPLELDIRAAESWRTTVPQDLQLPAPSN
jgi:hypothetical protein